MNCGIIVKSLSGYYYVSSAAGMVTCRARGRFRKNDLSPLVGDKVNFSVEKTGEGYILQIFPRRNSFIRPAVANIDLMIMVASAANPTTDPFLIDRISALASFHNCGFLVCINKTDLDDGDTIADIYRTAGIPFIRTSTITGEGIDELRRCMNGKTCAFTGNSGVGKSSLLNTLLPDICVQTGDISERLGRGRHTTRHVELFALGEDTYIADTPGFGSFDINQDEVIRSNDLQFCFPEFQTVTENCRFSDCKHLNEPDCSIQRAVKDGKISDSRYNSYRKLMEQAIKLKDWQ